MYGDLQPERENAVQPILPFDDDVTCYRVEVYDDYRNHGDPWCPTGADDRFTANVPRERRITPEGLKRLTGEHQEPFHQFSASGECWQRWGIHGTLDEGQAFEMAKLLSQYNPGWSFRVVRHHVVQTREQLAEFTRTKVRKPNESR